MRAADQAIRAVASRLELALSECESLARFGGGQFAVLCERVGGERGAITVAGRLLKAFDHPLAIDDRLIFLSASVGIAVATERAVTAEALLRDAAIATRRAKEHGGGHYELFDQVMLRRVVERVNLEQDLRRGLERDELTLHYQPIVSLRDGDVVALEALVRWQHPELGLVPPDAFMPVAEESGLICPLGKWVLTTVCRQIARSSFDAVEAPYLTVNVSRRQLLDPTLPEALANILRQTGVSPRCLGLEVAESAVIDHDPTPVEVLQQLERLGVRILLADFGTGYSSLNLLKRLPLQALKVDRSFVAGIAEAQ